MSEYPIERYVDLLANRLTERIDLLTQALTPPGQRPPFSQQLNKPQALNWWRKHRYDDLGKQVLANMDQISVLELDQALTRQNEMDAMRQLEPIPEDIYG